MATDKDILAQAIVDYLNNTCEWNISSEPPGAEGYCLAQGIAEAVVNHIKDYATVTIDSGSSAGTYQVE